MDDRWPRMTKNLCFSRWTAGKSQLGHFGHRKKCYYVAHYSTLLTPKRDIPLSPKGFLYKIDFKKRWPEWPEYILPAINREKQRFLVSLGRNSAVSGQRTAVVWSMDGLSLVNTKKKTKIDFLYLFMKSFMSLIMLTYGSFCFFENWLCVFSLS